MMRDAKFYFGNLMSDIARCVAAALHGSETRYRDSLVRARKTLGYLRTARRPEAYEEGLLLVRALAHARARGTLPTFRKHLAALALLYTPL